MNTIVRALVVVTAYGAIHLVARAKGQDLIEEAPSAAPVSTPQAMPTIQTEEFHGSGGWTDTADVRAASVGQRWSIDALHFSDDRISGRIGISGSDIIDSANVDAQLSGRGVRGKLLDDDGKELAEFDGTVTSAGAFGTYRGRTGDEGEWQWEGKLQPLKSQP